MKSLRLRLMITLGVAITVLWSSVAAWMFVNLRQELMHVLDDRLIASTRMVAGIVQQFAHSPAQPVRPGRSLANGLSVIARDGVACEVSLVRSEVELLPIARTENSPGFEAAQEPGFGSITKGGKPWRTYVLEENGIRIATADRLDVREHLVQSFAYAMALPFALVLLGLLALTWWVSTLALKPLHCLQQTLAHRPSDDATPIQDGQDVKELAPMVNSLNALLARMNAAIEHERRWTADAAHELRTPLTAIKTHVQVAQLLVQRESRGEPHPQAVEQAAEQVQQALQQAMRGIAHMHGTLEQLLLLARVESGSAVSSHKMQGTQVPRAFEHACEQSAQRATAHQLPAQLAVRITPEKEAALWQTWQLALPEPLFTCAVSNLLDNALRHHRGPQPVHVTLEWLEAAGALRITVRDHGPGMTAQECVLALQRFWRRSPTGQGSGLGLTLVQRIAASVQGQLQLAPAEGTGLCVTLTLPTSSDTSTTSNGLS